MSTEKARENRLRRAAERQGLRLVKSRSRDPQALDYGLYGLIIEEIGGMVNPALIGRYVCSWTLEQVEDYLTGDEPAPEPIPRRVHSVAQRP